MEIKELNIEDLIPYEKNPRNNENAVDYVANSIKSFGFKVPIIIDNQNVIVAGHTRWKAARKLNIKKVPCIVADDLTPEQVRAFRLADNKVAEQATWDFDLLDEELSQLLDFNMDDFGFDVAEDEPPLAEDDDIPEPPEEPISRYGQVYQLGNHYLMCGDSTNADDVATLMRGGQADLLITDPPYNVDYTGKTKEAMKIENDSMDPEEFKSFLINAFRNAFDSMKDGAAFYIWYASREVVNFSMALAESGLTVKQELIWNKNSMVMGRQDYQWKHEPCLYGWKETASHHWYSDRKQTTIIDWDRPTSSQLHPTMKPVGLFDYQMRNSTQKGDIVLDLFGGSGTSLIAAEQNGRICYMMEYDPKYVDVIIERWEALTGGKAVLING